MELLPTLMSSSALPDPGRLDLAPVDPGVADRFLERLDHQVRAIPVPAFAEDLSNPCR
jgi:hypothetical protein